MQSGCSRRNANDLDGYMRDAHKYKAQHQQKGKLKTTSRPIIFDFFFALCDFPSSAKKKQSRLEEFLPTWTIFFPLCPGLYLTTQIFCVFICFNIVWLFLFYFFRFSLVFVGSFSPRAVLPSSSATRCIFFHIKCAYNFVSCKTESVEEEMWRSY